MCVTTALMEKTPCGVEGRLAPLDLASPLLSA